LANGKHRQLQVEQERHAKNTETVQRKKEKTRRIQTERPEQRPVPHRLLHPEKGPRVAEPSKQKQEGMQKIPTIANDSTRTRGHGKKQTYQHTRQHYPKDVPVKQQRTRSSTNRSSCTRSKWSNHTSHFQREHGKRD